MSVKYKLIQRKDMSTDAGPGSKLYYAQAVSAGEMTLDELCEDIAESSTVTSADVKAMTLGSSGAPTIEEFNSSLIRKPKVSFHPGKRLQETRSLVSFERIGGEDSTSPTSPDGEGEEEDGGV